MSAEEDPTSHRKPTSAASSVEEAVNELLLMTSEAVKKLTDSKERKPSISDSEGSEDSMDQKPSKLKEGVSDELTAYKKDKRLLEILSETQHSNLEQSQEEGVVLPETEGRTIDITAALEQDKHSDVSILDVAGGQPDSYSSTPSSASHEGAAKSKSASDEIAASKPTETDYPEVELPGDSIFSPISFSPDLEHIEKDEHGVDGSFVQQSGEKNLTSSIKRKADDIATTSHSSGNTSSASEVLINSTRIPQAPVKRIFKAGKTDNNTDITNLTAVQMAEKEPSTQIIMRKSSHKESPVLTESKGQQNAIKVRFTDGEISQQRVKISKKRLREVKSPVETPIHLLAMKDSTGLTAKETKNKSLSMGLVQGIETDGKENKKLDADVNIIMSRKEVAKKRLLEAKGKRRPIKQVIPVNMVRRDAAYPIKSRKSDSVSTAAAVASAIASTTPMLQVKYDLEAQVKRLTEKLDELEKQKQLEAAAKHQERVDELEKKLSELTAQRLRSLEQLQEQQAAWQTHFLKVVGNMQSTQKHLTKAVKTKHDQSPYVQARGVRFRPGEENDSNQNVLQTPAPRVQAPMPTRKHIKGMSPGKGRLLQNILDQWDVSTPGPSPSIPFLKKNLHDPLADVTPVRGPSQHADNNFPKTTTSNAVNLTTSTPQDVVADTRSAVLQARKEAHKETERLEILRRFPSSLSQYLTEPTDVRPATTDLPPMPTKNASPKKTRSLFGDLWKGLKELQQTRKYLDDNLAAVERGRNGESIADKVNLEIYMQHPDADQNLVEKLRIRQMVDEQIKALQAQIKNEVTREQSYDTFIPKKKSAKSAGRGRLPKPTTGARVDTGLRRQAPQAKGRGRRPRSASPHDRSIDTICVEDEDYVTHVYGKADYHPRRTTVHDPYIHIKTPVKQATFRKKQAVEIVKANLIKSAKTQTSPHASRTSQYYFSPSTSPVHPPICVSPTPGQLVPMAIPLRPPRVCDAAEPVPLIIEQREPRFVTLTTQSPKKEKKFRIYDPSSPEMQALERTKKPNAAVINVRGVDGLEVHKLPNVDIDTDVSHASMPDMPRPTIHDDGEMPGSMPLRRGDEDISEESEGTLEIKLCGNAGNEPEVNYYGPEFPPSVPPQRTGFRSDQISHEIGRNELENEAIRWIEQEIMARILTELHPPGGMKIHDTGPVCDVDSEERVDDHDSVLLNPESLQLFVDAGLPIDAGTVNRLVEEEISAILREMIRQFGQEQMTKPKEPVQVPASAPSYHIPTPLPTPRPSPASSIAEKPKSLHTPSITPESSMAESVASHEESPPPTPKVHVPSPKAASPPKSPDRTPVQTPEATPPGTPTPEPSRAATPALSESEKVVPSTTPPLEFPDPWGGTEFPLPEEVGGKKKPSAMTFAPLPDAVDLVVREVTPPPASPRDRSELSDTETPTTSSSDDHGESSLSEGQLIISHGEMRARTKPERLPGIIEELFTDEDVERSMAFQSTLRDANELQNEEYEPCSDGEIRLSMRPSMISRVAGHGKRGKKQRTTITNIPPGDDPAGIYTRPRHPLPDIEDEEDISVGEVRPKTSNVARRNKFRQWREQRSLSQKSEPKNQKREHGSALSNSPPLSMDDLSREAKESEMESYGTDQSQDLSDSQMVPNMDDNVIMVSSKKSDRNKFVSPSNEEQKSLLQFALPTMSTLSGSRDMERTGGGSTDQSIVPKDSLDESMNRQRNLKDQEDIMDQTPLKVSLTLPSVEHSGASSEPVTEGDDISEISTGGL